jgi:hypothetical protein
MGGYVFETATGRCVALFEDDMDARAYAQRKNKACGAGTHDWANTQVKPSDVSGLS